MPDGDLRQLAQVEQLSIGFTRPDGSTGSTPIWVVQAARRSSSVDPWPARRLVPTAAGQPRRRGRQRSPHSGGPVGRASGRRQPFGSRCGPAKAARGSSTTAWRWSS